MHVAGNNILGTERFSKFDLIINGSTLFFILKLLSKEIFYVFRRKNLHHIFCQHYIKKFLVNVFRAFDSTSPFSSYGKFFRYKKTQRYFFHFYFRGSKKIR